MKTIYNKRYAEEWIKNHESKKDIFRTKHLEPYLKKIIKENPLAKILDVGCGWEVIANFIKKQDYTGVDTNKHFFEYIKIKNKNKKITLKKGSLPKKINISENDFDLVICSMVLHTTPSLKSSIKTIFKKIEENKKAIIIDFNDFSETKIRKGFFKIKKSAKKQISGKYRINSGIELNAEVYFHKEKEIETEIKKYALIKRKQNIGPFFVSWECVKK